MKFTEGYWLRKESVQASYASQAYAIERIPHGIRIAAPERPIKSRADALDITVLYVDIVSSSHNDIEVRVSHFMAYDEKEPRFELHKEPDDVEVEELEDETVLTAGDMKVRVSRKDWNIRFEADGRLLTSWRPIWKQNCRSSLERRSMVSVSALHHLSRTGRWWICGMKTAGHPALSAIRIFHST